MGAEYRLDFYDTSGAKTAEVTDYLSLAYRKVVNAPGLLRFTLKGDSNKISTLSDKGVVEVWRRNSDIGLTWTQDFVSLFRSQGDTQKDVRLFTANCPGILTMLGWRIVAWYAGTTNRSDFTTAKAETILKTLVSYNAGSNATTANGRWRAGVDGSNKLSGLYTISNQADGAAGNSLSIGCAWDNLLDALQAVVAKGSGGDFDLIKTGGTAFEFRWYTGQRGTSRTTSVYFSLDRGNMSETDYSYDRTDEATVAIVGGQGQTTYRTLVTRTGTDYGSTNDIETFVNGTSYTTTAALNAIGDGELFSRRARQVYRWKALQAPNAYYGVHYVLGDLVTAIMRGTSSTQKVTAVDVEFTQNGEENISMETKTDG